jgi:hypothetical protein
MPRLVSRRKSSRDIHWSLPRETWYGAGFSTTADQAISRTELGNSSTSPVGDFTVHSLPASAEGAASADGRTTGGGVSVAEARLAAPVVDVRLAAPVVEARLAAPVVPRGSSGVVTGGPRPVVLVAVLGIAASSMIGIWLVSRR